MDHALPNKKEENRRKGIIVSVMVHALLLLIALIPYMVSEQIPKELSGIVVAFGAPDAGRSNANPISDSQDRTANTTAVESSSSDQATNSTAPQKEETYEDPSPDTKPVQDMTPVSNTSDVTVDDSKKEENERAEAAAEAERQKRLAEERASIEAQKEAEAKAKKAAFDDSKSKFSDLLGSGKGSNNNDGNEGDPKGDPNSDALNKIATGSGRIGGGLANRGVLYEPEINDNSQYTGVVVVKVCVNSSGKVVEANFTQRGSTTTNKVLVDIAIDAAKKYKFTSSEVETQCGNITIEFKVK